jgi:1,4-dihydroxy-2-naphthoate octaprenyltransferase
VRLLARGLGELDTALVVAILVPLCAYAAQGTAPDLRAIASTLPGAAAMFAMMLAVEYPDLRADTASGKANLVVRLGAGPARPLGMLFVAAAYGTLALAWAAGAPPGFFLLETLSLPLGIGLARAFSRRNRPDRVSDETLAARGVAFFFVVVLYGLLGYGAAPHGPAPHGRSAATATNPARAAVLAA